MHPLAEVPGQSGLEEPPHAAELPGQHCSPTQRTPQSPGSVGTDRHRGSKAGVGIWGIKVQQHALRSAEQQPHTPCQTEKKLFCIGFLRLQPMHVVLLQPMRTCGGARLGPVTSMALKRPSSPGWMRNSTSSPSLRLLKPSASIVLCSRLEIQAGV